MKKLLFMGAFLISGLVNAQNVNIPDANFKNYLVNNPLINTDGGNEIEASEAAVFAGYIDCKNLSISDLTGIEAFTSLTRLSCRDNNLTNLDLSQNTALTSLFCNRNNLTSLDLSQNTILDNLECSHNNLNSLNISQNTILTYLFANNNNLTLLDISQNTNLEVLTCSHNSLNELDISLNIALTHLLCQHNNLTQLDVSSNSALTNFWCFNNNLACLNIKNGNNANIIDFLAENNTNLTCIEADAGYSSTNVDPGVSFNTSCICNPMIMQNAHVPDVNLKNYLIGNTAINTNGDNEIQITEAHAFNGEIDCSNLSISDLTGIKAFTSLTRLRCNDNNITNLDISQNTNLLSLFCGNNNLSNLDVSLNPDLKELWCNNNNITNLDVSLNTNLLHLVCTENNLSNLDVSLNPDLINLWCYDNNLNILNISQNTNLKYLICKDNNLSCLNIKNGNNSNLIGFIATNNPNLTCIQADAGYSSAGVDLGVTFSTNCDTNCNPSCTPSSATAFTFPSNNSITGTYPVINVSNATVDTEVRISTDPNFGTYQMIPQSAGSMNKFPTMSLSLCYSTTYYIQVRDNNCSTWSTSRSFTTRDYAKQWATNLSHNPANPKPLVMGQSIVSNALNSGVDQLEWYIEEVNNPGNILSTPFYNSSASSVRHLRINDIAPLLTYGAVYRVIIKGTNASDTYCGSFNDYTLLPDGDVRYRSAYFRYENSTSNKSGFVAIPTVKNEPVAKLSCYPNPSLSGVFQLELTGFKAKKTVQVTDLEGRTILNLDINDSQTKIDLSAYAKGVYFIRVNDGVTVEQQKIIIQ